MSGNRGINDAGNEGLSRTTTVKRGKLPTVTLGQQIMAYVPGREQFTGQVNVEVHCKNGVVVDVYLAPRWKLKEA